jgi:plastocyanin
MGKGRRRAISTVIAVIAGLGAAAQASAAENADVYVVDTDIDHLCFTTDSTATTCPADGADVAIAPGDTVTWHFASTGTFGGHNAADADHGSSPTWKVPASGFVTTGTGEKTFDTAGVYKFLCQAHPQMHGTVTVGTPPPPPPPPDDNPPPSSPPPTGTHPVTPPPSPAADTVKPSVRKVKLKALRRAVRVRFRLSEAATVTLRAKRGRKVVVAKRVQASAGTHTVTLRSKRLKKGRYVVQIQARDAFGNRSKLATKRLALRR